MKPNHLAHPSSDFSERVLDFGDTYSPDAATRDREAYRETMAAVIVSRHAGAIEWLRQWGYTGPVISGNAAPDDVRGKVVIGNLPLHLAALADRVGSIDMPNLADRDRGRDLTPEEMEQAGATINWYIVRRETDMYREEIARRLRAEQAMYDQSEED